MKMIKHLLLRAALRPSMQEQQPLWATLRKLVAVQKMVRKQSRGRNGKTKVKAVTAMGTPKTQADYRQFPRTSFSEITRMNSMKVWFPDKQVTTRKYNEREGKVNAAAGKVNNHLVTAMINQKALSA